MTSSDWNPLRCARSLMRNRDRATLATLHEDGSPHASLVLVAAAMDGSPILLLSKLALHTQNLLRDGRASLLLVGPFHGHRDPLEGERLTLNGQMEPDRDPRTREAYLADHEQAAGYAAFTDFGFWRMNVERGHLVAGFGRIHSLPGADLLD